MWAPVTLFVSSLALAAEGLDLVFFVVWLVFGWAGVVLIPYTRLMRRWRESVVVDSTAITLSSSGPLTRRSLAIPLDQIVEISIGYMGRFDGETLLTLNVIRSRARFGHVDRLSATGSRES